MTVDKTDPETEAMLAGAEIEKGAAEGQDVQHTPRTHPVDQPPATNKDHQAPLTTDSEAQRGDSVINPESS